MIIIYRYENILRNLSKFKVKFEAQLLNCLIT